MERHVKERLVGAAVLIAAAVVLIPELLSGPKRPVAAAPIARAGEAPMKTYTIDLNHSPDALATVEESAPPPESSAMPSENADSMALTPGEPVVAASAAAESEPRFADDSSPAVAAASPSPRKPDVAQVRSAQRNPDSASDKVASSKPKADAPRSSPPKSPEPQPSVASPSKALASAPAAPSSPGKGKQWAVQLGSFASKANADRLVKEWAGRGETGLASPIKSGNVTLYRVRLGPFADRAKADAALRKVKPSIAGAAVVAHP